MEKTIVSLFLTLVISVLGIPAAYLVGQHSAEARHREDIARMREEQRHLVAAIRGEIQPLAAPEFVAHTEPAHSIPASIEEPARETVARAVTPIPIVEPAAPAAAAPEASSPPIPEAAFEAAAIGTPYDQVVRDFGREGEPMMTLEDGHGSITTQYAWDWRDPDGSPNRIRMRFVDGRLIEKSGPE